MRGKHARLRARVDEREGRARCPYNVLGHVPGRYGVPEQVGPQVIKLRAECFHCGHLIEMFEVQSNAVYRAGPWRTVQFLIREEPW